MTETPVTETPVTETVQPEGWPRPRGYANGMIARGRLLFVAGQIGWDAAEQIVGEDLASQWAKALDNVLAVVRAAGAEPEQVVRLTIYCTDLDAYRTQMSVLGALYRERFGKHFPAMSMVGVAGLVHPLAKVEIEATAVMPEERV